MAVDVELQFAQGVAKRRIVWQDGELTDIRIPAGPLGVRRCLPAAGDAGLWNSYRLEDGAGPALQARAAADGTPELARDGHARPVADPRQPAREHLRHLPAVHAPHLLSLAGHHPNQTRSDRRAERAEVEGTHPGVSAQAVPESHVVV